MFQPCISDGFWAKLRSFSPNRLPNYWIRNLCWDHPRKWRGSGQYSSLAESWRQTTCSYEEDSTRNCFLMFFFQKEKKQCLYVLVMFSPDVIKIVSWMLSFKCVKKQFGYLGKRLESWNNHATPWVFQTTVFLLVSPPKATNPLRHVNLAVLSDSKVWCSWNSLHT